jgi:hypothetical protein
VGVVLVAVAMVMAMAVSSAMADPSFEILSSSNTNVAPSGTLTYYIQIANRGDTETDGVTPYTLTAALPEPNGLTAVSAGGSDWDCSSLAPGASSVSCTDTDVIGAHQTTRNSSILRITVQADAAASGVLSTHFDLSGGGAPVAAELDRPATVSDSDPGFGIEAFANFLSADVLGSGFSQAGGHPYAITTRIGFNKKPSLDPSAGDATVVEPSKDVVVGLPPGVIGNPTATPTCTALQLSNTVGADAEPLCPSASQVGVATVFTNTGNVLGPPVPVFNVVAPTTAPARLGMNVAGSVIVFDVKVRSDSDYGLSVAINDIPEGIGVAGTDVTLWGVPSDPSHNGDHACPGGSAPWQGGPTCPAEATGKTFLRNTTSCTASPAALISSVASDSWFAPARFGENGRPDLSDPRWVTRSVQFPQATGCDQVPFDPSLSAVPAAPAQAGEPAGFTFDVNVPQSDSANQIGEGDVKSVVTTLPAGVVISSSAAGGLDACSPAQVALNSTNDVTCPDASKVGELTIHTPLLATALEGSIYLATQNDNPFNSLVAIYLVAKGSGVIVKIPGHVELDPQTGQVKATFDNNPQAPFTNLHLVFKGGARAPLANPPACGSYTTHSVFGSWSGATATSESSYTITQDGTGKPCSALGFSPGFAAGTTNPVSGAFSPFALRLQRTDADSEFGSLSSLSLPPGLLGNVASITSRCTIEQADTHSCPAASHIGEVTAGAGAGPDPFYVGGDVYLTGPYKGNPFGVAVVVHAAAGPFDLGYVVVKGAIQIHDDGSVTVATDPFPTILQGIPLQVKDIRVNLDRPGFMFNPTSCNQMSINGTVVSTDNQQAGVSSRFQVGECANLKFKPSLTVSTAGRTSKANGASLHVHLATHQGPSSAGAQRESNIAKVDVQLPVVLPARLPTLQKACTAAQFATDPAGCPVGSFIGTAIAHTPILASPLSGPAILVSHGGQAFPDLVLVLQGEGVRINLTGHTQIKKGITFNHFETVPDAPVSSFDLTLPQGPHGVLTTDIPGRNLCATTRTVTVTKRVTRRINGHTRKVTMKAKKAVATPLLMPTTITAQNGIVLKQATKIAVTGCAKVKAKVKKAKTKRGRKH